MVTKEKLEEYDVYGAIEYVRSLEPPYKSRPSKPIVKLNANSKELREHLTLLEQWELDITEHEKVTSKERKISNERNTVLENYIKDQAGLFDVVPKDKQDKVWNYAWQQGHSSGYSEIYNYLIELVELFE